MNYDNTSWKELFEDKFKDTGDSWENVESSTLTEEQLNTRFDCGYGGIEGDFFTVWTKDQVYFPICYDGAEWIGSVSRNPDNKPTTHQGG